MRHSDPKNSEEEDESTNQNDALADRMNTFFNEPEETANYKNKRLTVADAFADDDEDDRPRLQHKLPPPSAIPAYQLLDKTNQQKALEQVKDAITQPDSEIAKQEIEKRHEDRTKSRDRSRDRRRSRDRGSRRRSRSRDRSRDRGSRRRSRSRERRRSRDRRRSRSRDRKRSRSRDRRSSRDRRRSSSKTRNQSIDKSKIVPKPVKNSADEKREKAQKIIDNIPSTNEKLFKFPIQWTFMSKPLIHGRINQWITKKIVEFIGEEEPDLTKVILEKVEAKADPKLMITEFRDILDSETEGFVVKLWRLMIYETEARRIGLIVDKK